jgi:two-component sensor histidine kinase
LGLRGPDLWRLVIELVPGTEAGTLAIADRSAEASVNTECTPCQEMCLSTSLTGAELSLAGRVNELAALYQLTDRLFRAASLTDVCDAALDAIHRTLHCQRASILLFDDSGIMKFVAWRGLSDGYRRAVEGHSPWTRDARDPEPICIDDITNADLPESLKATVRAECIGGLAFIPLLAKGEMVGKFMTYYDAPHVFANAEIELAVTIARQLGFALERLRDADEQRRAQARHDLLARELHHRTKNLFAVVDAVVARSFAGKRTVKEAETAVLDRLHALAHAHALLVDQQWQGADIAEIVRTEMGPYADRVTIDGPSVTLNAQAAQNFALALHELATNAAKYGALSNLTGRVHISWSILQPDAHRQFNFRWEERGGPPVMPPAHKGFGSAVLEQVMAEYFGAPPQIEFAVGGVRYVVTGSLEAIAHQAECSVGNP